MFNNILRSVGIFVLVVLITVGTIGGCNNNNNSQTWDQIRAERLQAIDDYLEANPEAFESFRTAPLSIKQDILNFVGLQMIVFRLPP